MRVLVACESSGRVREAFRKLGHDAWSCDLLAAEDQSDFHFEADLFVVLSHTKPWDLMIAHPPCTHLSSSGARHFAAKRADGRQQEGVDFFLRVAGIPIAKMAIENPIGIMSTIYGKPQQIIQPWMFGHGETKATCLWLKGLPALQATQVVEGRESRVHRMSPGPDRWKERSRTYQGIANAMAEQWGKL